MSDLYLGVVPTEHSPVLDDFARWAAHVSLVPYAKLHAGESPNAHSVPMFIGENGDTGDAIWVPVTGAQNMGRTVIYEHKLLVGAELLAESDTGREVQLSLSRPDRGRLAPPVYRPKHMDDDKAATFNRHLDEALLSPGLAFNSLCLVLNLPTDPERRGTGTLYGVGPDIDLPYTPEGVSRLAWAAMLALKVVRLRNPQ